MLATVFPISPMLLNGSCVNPTVNSQRTNNNNFDSTSAHLDSDNDDNSDGGCDSIIAAEKQELEYRNKILQFKWEIYRKRFLSERLWQASTDELEALEACYWLKATGFSSYVKMYEENKFPIDINTADSCNEMLDSDSLQSLIKRLETLNKCAKLLNHKSVEKNKSTKQYKKNSELPQPPDLPSSATIKVVKTTATSSLTTPTSSLTTSTLTEVSRTTSCDDSNKKITNRSRSFSDSECEVLCTHQQSKRTNDTGTTTSDTPEELLTNSRHDIFSRTFSHTCSFPIRDSPGTNNNNNNDNNNYNKDISCDFHDNNPRIVIKVEDCDQLSGKTADEILQNIRNSIYDNVPSNGVTSPDVAMLNKVLPSDVNIAFDDGYFVADLNIHVNQKMNVQQHVSSEDDDDDIESLSSQDDGEEIDEEVESIHSLNHLDIPCGMPDMKKPGMGSVDSGVPSSPVMRSPSVRKRRVRWHSFQKSCDRESMLVNNKIMSLSAGQLNVLKKLSLLRLTALLERYSCNNRSGWHWTMPKLLKKFKAPDYRDRNIFGVPLLVIAERTGNPLPHPILLVLNHLRRLSIDSVGIFRKSGMKLRIEKLRTQLENNPDKVSFDDYSVYDVADALKQYFRELPEPLLTTKLVDTFISIHKDIPKELRLQAMQLAIILMPDENRDLLQTVLMFLSDVASHSYVNQMTEKNLATCFVPAFFHLCGGSARNDKYMSSAPKKLKRSTSVQCQKELDDTMAAQECLSEMMKCVRFLFCVPDDVMMKSQFSYIQAGDPVSLEELGQNSIDPGVDDGYQHYLDNCFAGLLQESSSNKWEIHSDTNGIVLSFRKINDGYPLRLWRSVTEIMASPEEILKRLVKERHLWDDQILHWGVLEVLDENTDVFYYETQSVAPSIRRDFVALRSWRKNLSGGSCGMVMTSVKHKDEPPATGVRGTILACRCLIEPIGLGRSRMTYVARIDLRGRSSRYYNKAIAPRIMAAAVREVRESFNCGPDGPETNV